MFSVQEKKHIAEVLEKTLLELKHPEMPEDKPRFKIHINGKEGWSFADIEPNWTFDENKKPGVSPWNEDAGECMAKKADKP